jgi:hypothetical protein
MLWIWSLVSWTACGNIDCQQGGFICWTFITSPAQKDKPHQETNDQGMIINKNIAEKY